MADLSTDTKKVEEYNKGISEAKNDQKIDASDAAFNIALSAARSDVFPPFGLISFKQNQATDDRSMKSLVDQTIKGAQNFYTVKLDSANADRLIYEDIITSNPVFKKSKAVTDLEAKTKSDFKEIKSVIDSKKDDPTEKTGNRPVDKLSESSLTSILASTMVDFLKEIGLKRENAEAGDKYNKENGAESLKQLETASKPAAESPIPSATPVPATITPAISPIATAKTPSEANKSKEQREGKSLPSLPPVALSLPVTKPTVSISNTQTNVTNTGGTANTTKTNNVSVKSESTQIATPVLPTQPPVLPSAATTAASIPQITTGESSSGGPISSALFEVLGISQEEEGQAMIRGGNPENIESPIYQALPLSQAVTSAAPTAIGSAVAVPQNALATAKTETKAIAQSATQLEAAKIVKGEATKITNQVAPKIEQPKTQSEEPTPQILENKSDNTGKSSSATSENKQEPVSETKNESSPKNEESENINSQLLSVMQEILNTLRGPLIFSEDRPRFI